MHGPVQKCFSAGAGALVHCRISGSDDAQKPDEQTKRRRMSVAGQSFSAAHVTEQNMSWSLVLSCCIVGNLAEFSSSCTV